MERCSIASKFWGLAYYDVPSARILTVTCRLALLTPYAGSHASLAYPPFDVKTLRSPRRGGHDGLHDFHSLDVLSPLGSYPVQPGLLSAPLLPPRIFISLN